MSRIIVFTDIHFNANRAPDSVDPVERLKSGLNHVAKHHKNVDKLVITGDLTHHGDVESYELLKDTIELYDLPFTLLIGNHDNRENFLSVFNNPDFDYTGFVQNTFEIGNRKLILLDTLDGPPYDYPKSHRGFLCDARLNWLDEELKTAGEKRCIIFMHHPPHEVGFRAMDSIKLVNSEAFYGVIKKYNNVEHISCGHIHRTISGNYLGIPFSIFKSTVGQMPMLFETMDFGVETLEPAAYGIIDIYENGLNIHTEDYELTDLTSYN